MNSEWVANLEELAIWQDETFKLLLHLLNCGSSKFVTLFIDRRQGKTTLLLRLAAYFKQHGKTIQVFTPGIRTIEQFQSFISPPCASGTYDVCFIDDVEYCANIRKLTIAPSLL